MLKIQVQKNTSEPFLTMVINPEFQCVEEHHNCWKLPLSLLLHELLEKALSPCDKILLTNRLSSCGASWTGTIRYAYLGQFGNTVGAAVGCSRVSFSGMVITFLVLFWYMMRLWRSWKPQSASRTPWANYSLWDCSKCRTVERNFFHSHVALGMAIISKRLYQNSKLRCWILPLGTL